MLQKFKITSYALIIGLVLVLPSQTIAESGYAESCAGWNCTYEGQVCPQGAKGASDRSYICRNSKWVPILAESCAGYDCSHEGQLCPEGAEGARGTSFICLNFKWVPTYCEESTIIEGLFGFAFFHKQFVAQLAAEHSGALCAGGGGIK